MSDETQPVHSGRPTDYRPEYDDLIIKHAENELCMYEIAVEFKVAYETLRSWARSGAYPSYSSAYARACTIQAAHQFKKLRDNEGNRNWNAKVSEIRVRHELKMSEKRLIEIDLMALPFNEMVQRVLQRLKNEGLTGEELNQALTAIAIAAKVDEVTEQRGMLEEMQAQLDERNK